MASFETLVKLGENPDWIAPRSDVRVFLGEPGAPEATKTTVEPGNAFSPGMRTFGVTWWLRFPVVEGETFYTPESAAADTLHWRYEEGYGPILHCETEAQGLAIHHCLLQDGCSAERSEAVCGQLRLVNRSPGAQIVQLFLVLRSLGPAGGPVHDLAVGSDKCSFWSVDRDVPLLGFDTVPDAIGCGVGDPSADARAGRVPAVEQVHDLEGWCYGLARYDVSLAPGEGWQISFDCPQQTYGALQRELPGTAPLRPEQYPARAAAMRAAARARWAHLALDTPDADFRHAFFAGLQHMLIATVGDQARIAPLSYPLPWLRDSVYLIRCFDLAGLHDLARSATEYCVRNDFFGGFGAEGDAPGQGIWAIVQHYRIARDRAWLAHVFPAVERKCEWLLRMRLATAPIQIVTDTPILPFMHSQRAAGIICNATQDGLIQGVMDHGIAYSLGWINQWALCGLREAAYAAAELGLKDKARHYEEEASSLQTALTAYSARVSGYFDLERTVNSLLWPTRAWANAVDQIEKGFDAWWKRHRGEGDAYHPEPYWLYFEFAQAHNALLLGQRERAWQVIQYRLAHQDLPGLYGWREGGDGVGTENAVHGVTLVNQLRGCQRFDSITPHGWSQAEMWLLQRAVLVEEWQDGLLLFAGVPSAWLVPGASVGFRGLPTWYGTASAQLQIDGRGEGATITISGIQPGTPVWVRLPGNKVAAVAGDDILSLSIGL